MKEIAAALVEALDIERAGDWQGAREAVQKLDGSAAAWVHAYLHRREGDIANARYWYNRAGREPSEAPLAEEWAEIRRQLAAAAA